MTLYVDGSPMRRLAESMLERAKNAQPCTYMAGEWVMHPMGVRGRVVHDHGSHVTVLADAFGTGIKFCWKKEGLHMIAPPEESE